MRHVIVGADVASSFGVRVSMFLAPTISLLYG